MKVLSSPLLTRAGFNHGFGTRLSTADDYPADIHILKQVHGERIVVLTAGRRTVGGGRSGSRSLVGRNLPEDQFRFDEGDAMVTDIPGVSIGIRTADCLPVLVGDRLSGAVAAIHCGWRSLALGLAAKGIEALINLTGSVSVHQVAALGPSIGPCCYEVGEDVYNALVDPGHDDAGLFETRGEGIYLNLGAAAKAQLIDAGMLPQNIEEITGCTMCSRDLFWSYRGGEKEKRMISWITARQV